MSSSSESESESSTPPPVVPTKGKKKSKNATSSAVVTSHGKDEGVRDLYARFTFLNIRPTVDFLDNEGRGNPHLGWCL